MPGKEFTVTDLQRILRAAAGPDAEIGTDAGTLDTSFEDLGLDSLAVLETGARIEREVGVRLEDSDLVQTLTPSELIDLVNAQLAVFGTR